MVSLLAKNLAGCIDPYTTRFQSSTFTFGALLEEHYCNSVMFFYNLSDSVRENIGLGCYFILCINSFAHLLRLIRNLIAYHTQHRSFSD